MANALAFGWLLTAAAVVAAVSAQCPSCPDLSSPPDGYTSVIYTGSDENLLNPHRGFYDDYKVKASSYSPLTQQDLDTSVTEVGATVILLQVVLDSFRSSDISATFLQNINTDMATVRAARMTVVLRFSYTDDDTSPYQDASKTWVLRHIAQLQPFLTVNADVIDTIQAGFIGVWGEWYYTSHFGFPSSGAGLVDGLTAGEWADRQAVVDALLAAAPPQLTVSLRKPIIKYHMLGDTSPTSPADRNAKNKKGRLGHHNDCFLASQSDYGTYNNKTFEYPYLEADTEVSWMGGETCTPTSTAYYSCADAQQTMERFHWSYLNQRYHKKILCSWRDDGCYGNIFRRLGYRLQLVKSVFPADVVPGGSMCFSLQLQNVGYSAPHKQTSLKIVLQNTASGSYYAGAVSGVDVRDWLPGQVYTVTSSLAFPAALPTGNYKVLLELADEAFSGVSDYSILLANTDVPQHSSGLNSLLRTLQVLDGSGSVAGCPVMTSMSAPVPSRHFRSHQCNFGASADSRCADEGFSGTNPQNCGSFVWLPPPNSGCSLLKNGGFEESVDWDPYNAGFSYSSSQKVAGSRSLKVTASGGKAGAKQKVTFGDGTSSMTIAAWSKSSSLSNPSSSDFYGIYSDVELDDGTPLWGQNMEFPAGSNAWHQRVKHFTAPAGRTMSYVSLYAMVKNFGSGSARFDNVIVAPGDLTCSAVTGNAFTLCVPQNAPDPSFEEGGVWQQYGSQGFSYSTEAGRTGARSIKLTDGAARHVFQFPADSGVHTLTLQAYSKPVNVPGSDSSGYSLYCDVTHPDGSSTYGYTEEFPVNGTGWTQRTLVAATTKGIKEAWCYLMFRNYGGGHAYFDDVTAFTDGMPCS